MSAVTGDKGLDPISFLLRQRFSWPVSDYGDFTESDLRSEAIVRICSGASPRGLSDVAVCGRDSVVPAWTKGTIKANSMIAVLADMTNECRAIAISPLSVTDEAHVQRPRYRPHGCLEYILRHTESTQARLIDVESLTSRFVHHTEVVEPLFGMVKFSEGLRADLPLCWHTRICAADPTPV